jgi:hypothetical protein
MYRDAPFVLSATETPVALRLDIICRAFDEATVIFKVFDAMLVLPFASVIAPAAIDIALVPPMGPVAVYVTVREVPVVVSPESEPRVTLRSAINRSATSSLSVMVMLHVVPAA